MDISDLPTRLPLFPLYGALLLPRLPLPLHIFEPRYLAMLEDCLQRPDRVIGLIQPVLPQEGARLQLVGCAGRVTAFVERPDGRYDITLTGLCRFKLLDTPECDSPWRLGLVSYEGFEGDIAREAAADPQFDRAEFLNLLRRYLMLQGISPDLGDLLRAPDEVLLNMLSMLLPLAAEERQALLESPDLTDRRETLTTLLHYAVQKGPDEDEVLQ